jgi:Na+/H+ antiporter NhaD/arsenite permease-like protein
MTLPQVLAVAIFVIMFGLITWGKVHRYIPALGGAILVLVVVFLLVMNNPEHIRNVLNLQQLVDRKFWFPHEGSLPSRGINWQTIVFIAGMMIMVEGLAKVGFFRWMCLGVVRIVRYRVIPILISFMLLAGFLSMFIDSITVMLFLASVIVEVARLLKFDPVPLIIATIFASNTGGSATMSGDPPNIIIGTSFGYTFMDFLIEVAPISWVCMLLAVVYFYLVFRKRLTANRPDGARAPTEAYPRPREAIPHLGLFLVHTGIFILVVALLVAHAHIGISVATTGAIGAVLTLLATGKRAAYTIRQIDWRTLLFFIGLFVCVGGLEETGVQRIIAEGIEGVAGSNLTSVIAIILWLSAFASAIVDNIPFAATMVPVVSHLALTPGLHMDPMAFSLALGTDIGGNATPIGASANVVGTAVSEREGHPIGWGIYLKYSLPPMIICIAVCNLLLFIKY